MFKIVYVVLFVVFSSVPAFAAGNSHSDEKARYDQIQETMNRIAALEKRLSQRKGVSPEEDIQEDTQEAEEVSSEETEALSTLIERDMKAQEAAQGEVDSKYTEEDGDIKALAQKANQTEASLNKISESLKELEKEDLAIVEPAPVVIKKAEVLKPREAVVAAQHRIEEWGSDDYLEMTKEHEFDMGTEISYITYKEPDVSVEEKGGFVGLFANYNYRPQMGSVFRNIVNVYHLDAHVNYGQVDYEGSGTIDEVDDYLFEPRFWLGRDIALGNRNLLTPYAGIGYRSLYDNLGDRVSSTGALGYDRWSQYLYAPIGFELRSQVSPKLTLGLKAEYDIFIKGRQTSYLSDIPGYPDLENDQEKGFGLRGSFNVAYKADAVNYIVEPYVRYWHIQDSNIATATGSAVIVTGYEPENTSMETGVRLGVQF